MAYHPPLDAGERLEALEQATLSLHAPDQSADMVVALLEALVTDLGLSPTATFLAAEAGVEAGVQEIDQVEVRRPGGPLEGVLRCAPVDDEARRAIALLAAHAGVALATLARIRRIEEREEAVRRVAERLQDTLLPTPPEIVNTNLGVRYRAAAAEARVGGDFYDAFPLPCGRLLIVVGDVVGKGVEAASRTAQILYSLRTLAMQGLELDALLERVDEQVTYQDPDIMATIWCGLYDPGSGELAFASLGHPPALLLRAEGEPIRLALQGLPLGLRDLSPDPPEVRTRLLAPRDLLVLYTDGVVEASGDLTAGQDALLAAIERRRDEPLAGLIDGVLEEMLTDAGHLDDAVMLLLRRR